MSKNVWGKGGVHEGEYKRHSVDRDVKAFIGWKRLEKLFDALSEQSKTFRDVAATCFLCAGRISETLSASKKMFSVPDGENYVVVKDFPLFKRYRKKDHTLICLRCRTENNKFETACTQCGANLVYSARKKWVTENAEMKRLDFYIRLEDPFTDLLLNRLDQADDLLFPSSYTGRPYTRQWAYNIIKDYGQLIGLDRGYNHWLRSQRLMQLGNERGFTTDELKAFSGITKEETLSRYAKKIQSYTQKLGLEVKFQP